MKKILPILLTILLVPNIVNAESAKSCNIENAQIKTKYDTLTYERFIEEPEENPEGTPPPSQETRPAKKNNNLNFESNIKSKTLENAKTNKNMQKLSSYSPNPFSEPGTYIYEINKTYASVYYINTELTDETSEPEKQLIYTSLENFTIDDWSDLTNVYDQKQCTQDKDCKLDENEMQIVDNILQNASQRKTKTDWSDPSNKIYYDKEGNQVTKDDYIKSCGEVKIIEQTRNEQNQDNNIIKQEVKNVPNTEANASIIAMVTGALLITMSLIIFFLQTKKVENN